MHNVGYPRAIGAVSVINHYYARDDILLGAFKGEFGENSSGIYYLNYIYTLHCWLISSLPNLSIVTCVNCNAGAYIDDLVDNFESPVKNYDQVDEAVVTLRKTLAAAEVMEASLMMFPYNRDLQDSSVVIVSVGFLQNLAGLLQSPGDELSPSSGYELVRDKVGGTLDTALDTDLNLSTQVASVFVMGGYYPHSDLFSEFNFNCGRPFMGQVIYTID